MKTKTKNKKPTKAEVVIWLESKKSQHLSSLWTDCKMVLFFSKITAKLFMLSAYSTATIDLCFEQMILD